MNQSVSYNRTKGNHSPIRWYGGKHYQAKDIIDRIPEHHCYVEVFGGGAHVLASKSHSPVEVFNDIDELLVHFLLTLREQKHRLLDALDSLPVSRYLFHLWRNEPVPEDDFDRAVRWFYLLRNRIAATNAKIDSGYRHGKLVNNAQDYYRAVERLDWFGERMKHVNIEWLHYEKVIQAYDGKDTFFFVDPPYIGREKHYQGGFTERDHKNLAEILSTIQGKALVTYYPDPLIEECYKGWRREEIHSVKGTNVTKMGEEKSSSTEWYLMNYDQENQKINLEPRTTSGQLSLF